MAVAFVSSGGRDAADGNVNLLPPYPSSPVAGYLLVLRFGHINSGSQASATYSVTGGWNARYVADTQSSQRHWVYSKISDGTESGTDTVTVSGGIATGDHVAIIDMYSGVDTSVNDGFENGAVSKGSSSVVSDAGITTTTTGGMAVQCIAQAGSSTVQGTFSGQTGGTWAMTVDGGDAQTNANLPKTQLATATVNAGTIDGGTYSQSVSTAWINRGFGLKAAIASVGQPMSKRRGGIPFVGLNKGVW